MFLWLPAGAGALLAGQQPLAIGQQYADQLDDRPAERPRRRDRAAERRLKRVGGGKTDAARATRAELS